MNKKYEHFTREELAFLNQVISTALLSGQINCDDLAESVFKEVANEIRVRERDEAKEVG